jgi:hypothetical protein
LHSTVTSTPSATVKRARTASSSPAMSSGSSNDGVPPPKKIVSIATRCAHAVPASNVTSRRIASTYRRISAGRSSGAVLNEQ